MKVRVGVLAVTLLLGGNVAVAETGAPAATVDVVVDLVSAGGSIDSAQADWSRSLVDAGLSIDYRFKTIPAFAGTIAQDRITELTALPGVRRVRVDVGLEAYTTETLPHIGQPTVARTGERGGGTTVVVLDTGVDFTTPFFGCTSAGAPGCQIIASFDTATDDGARDDNGHGTNVSGIVGSVAPDTDIVVIDVFKVGLFGDNLARTGAISRALDWAADNAARLNIVAVNMSLGGGDFTQITCGWYNSEFQALRNAGVEPIVAAGNSGNKNKIAAPACSSYVTAIGAVHSGGPEPAGCRPSGGPQPQDVVAQFSQSSAKLDLYAPGVCVGVAGFTMTGTSQATPHVAGAWAVISASDPTLTRAQIRRRLQDTGVNVGGGSDVIRPRIDLDGALGFDLGIPGWADPGDNFGTSLANGDFDGDGFEDLAVGAPGETINGDVAAGSVTIISGSSSGLVRAGAQVWTQDSPGVPGGLEAGDRFGGALASADFNGDGYDDLAVGVPGEAIGSIDRAGMVLILYGSRNGLSAANSHNIHQDTAGVAGIAESGDQFGAVLAAGNFDGTGPAELAIGAPYESINGDGSAGALSVIKGTTGGLDPTLSRLFHQDQALVGGVSETGDRFAAALAAGDINGDGADELIVGVPFEDVGTEIAGIDVGMIHVLSGGDSAAFFTGDKTVHQDSPGIKGRAEKGDAFGSALAVADFDGDGFGDVAVGVPGESFEAIGKVAAGSVAVIYGAAAGLSQRDQAWHQNRGGIAGVAETGDRFGTTLAAGHIGSDGAADLVVGVPFETLESRGAATAGLIHVILGSTSGLSAVGSQIWHQDSAGIVGKAESNDRFGSVVVLGRFNADRAYDVAIGVANEGVGALGALSGAVNVLYSDGVHLSARGDQIWDQGK